MGNLKSYIMGFVISLILTLTAFFVVTDHSFNTSTKLIAIIVLAFTQLVTQLICFLHLHKNWRSSWNLLFFVSMFGIIVIVVLGSLWIMNHLNYNMSPAVMRDYIKYDEGVHK